MDPRAGQALRNPARRAPLAHTLAPVPDLTPWSEPPPYSFPTPASVCLYSPAPLPNAARVQTKRTPFYLLGERRESACYLCPAPRVAPCARAGTAVRGEALIVWEGTRKRASLVLGCSCPRFCCSPRRPRSLWGKLVAKFPSKASAPASSAQGGCGRRRQGQKRSSRCLCSALGDRPGQGVAGRERGSPETFRTQQGLFASSPPPPLGISPTPSPTPAQFPRPQASSTPTLYPQTSLSRKGSTSRMGKERGWR